MKAPRDLAAAAVYEPQPTAAAAARRFVRETLRSWQVPDSSGRLVDDAVLLTSELVTNAIVHAGTPLQVSCRLVNGEIEVAVRDRHPARTLGDSRVGDDAERTNGRGLLLPAALASSWGVSYARTAKAVWFRIAVGEEPAGRAGTGEPLGAGLAGLPLAGHGLTGHGLAGAGQGLAGQGLAGRGLSNGLPGGQVPQASDGHSDGIPSLFGHSELTGDIGRLSYDELLRHTVETARDVVGADAAYALVADEDGELRIRAGAGIGAPELLDGLAGPAARVAHGPADGEAPGQRPAVDEDAGLAGTDEAPVTVGRSLITVPFLAEGRVTGVLTAAASEPDRFGSGAADRLQLVADRVALSLERARLAELERLRRGRISFLAEASDLLAGTLDQDKTIALAAQIVVPRLAAWCAVFLADDGVSRLAYVLHADEALAEPLAALLASVPPPQVTSLSGARRWSLAGLPQSALPPHSAALAADAAWCFPLAARGRVVGALVIGRPRGRRFPREAVEMAEDLGRRAALVLDNARLCAQQSQTSQALQRSLLPPTVPRVPGLDLAAAYAAASAGNEVGGDFYDVFAAPNGRWRFAIGDVCGTGPEAAAMTGLARHAMRILAHDGRGIAAVLDRLNRLILDEGPRARFVTLVHGEIASSARLAPDRAPSAVTRVSMVCAGHPPPLLLRASGKLGPAVRPQPLLGVLDEVCFRASSVGLGPGDVLLCVTNGVTERRNGSGLLDDGDGLSRIFAGCAGLDAAAVAARIMGAVHDFAPQPPTDDTAVIVIRAL